MTAHTISRVLHHSTAKGMARLVLAVLAVNAEWRGNVTMSQRKIAELCNLSKTSVQKALDKLVSSGELQIMDPGGGRSTPAQYQIIVSLEDTTRKKVTETPPFVEDVAPDLRPQVTADEPIQPHGRETELGAVAQVLQSAGVADPGSEYWLKPEHAEDLDLIKKRYDMTLEAIIHRVTAERAAGDNIMVRRLTDLTKHWGPRMAVDRSQMETAAARPLKDLSDAEFADFVIGAPYQRRSK